MSAKQTNLNALDTENVIQIPLVGEINTILSITRAGNLCSTHTKQAGHILNFGFIASQSEANHKG